jgi:hypothetical protein
LKREESPDVGFILHEQDPRFRGLQETHRVPRVS